MILNLLNRNRKTVSLILLLSVIVFCSVTDAYSQSNELPYTNMELRNMNDFQSPAENWQLEGSLFMDVTADHDVQPEPGSGILVNTSSGENPQDIFTEWEHGDLDLELEFMMARNSNSGIYLQGRYELQMLDSWGVQNPKFSDMGGVYQWMDMSEGSGGIPPRINSSRAPGLWQHLSIKFRAPRFNDNGEKIAHAKLEEVKLNGVLIHRNVALVRPTGGAVSNVESASGPLRFQGDHGPVAFRNIRYKKYDNDSLQLQNLTYQYYEGEFESVSDIEGTNLAEEGSLEKINLNPLRGSGDFAVVYRGDLQIEESGDYYFDLRTDGGNQLSINGEVLGGAGDDNRRWDSAPVTISLDEGIHSFEIIYFRGARGGQPAVGIMAEGPGINHHNLHETGSLPVSSERIPYLVKPVKEPMVMHGFMDIEERVHTHTAAVGYPEKVNFAFDLNNGTVMKIWKGDFLDASTMWLGRGGGNLSLNEEGAITLGGEPSLAFLNNAKDAWPYSLQEGNEYTFKSYRFDKDGNLIFNYQLGQINIEEQIVPENEGRELTREITFHQEESSGNLYMRIIGADSIEKLPNNLFSINDKTFYIRLGNETRNEAKIRTGAGNQELIVPVEDIEGSKLSYSYIW